jgi:hypothetical protein
VSTFYFLKNKNFNKKMVEFLTFAPDITDSIVKNLGIYSGVARLVCRDWATFIPAKKYDIGELFIKVVKRAVEGGECVQLLELCRKWGADNDAWAMQYFAHKGQENLMRMCHDKWGVDNVNWSMAQAAAGNQEKCMRICHDEWGATDIDWALRYACKCGNANLAYICLYEWGATVNFMEMVD